MKRPFPRGTLLLFAVFVMVMLSTYALVKPSPPPASLEGVLRAEFRPIGSFELVDHNRDRFDEKRLAGQWTFVFFGYTHCPDVCPTTLYELRSVLGLLGDEVGDPVENARVLFVSVDPTRDTVERLAAYVPFYGEGITGATADPAEIDRLVVQFGAGYEIGPENASGHYEVAHTSSIFLLDPWGRLVASFSQPHYAATIASQFERIRTWFSQG